MCNTEAWGKKSDWPIRTTHSHAICLCWLSREVNRWNHVLCFRGTHTLCLSCCESNFSKQSCSKNQIECVLMLYSSSFSQKEWIILLPLESSVLMRRQWNKWMISGEHSFTLAGNMKVASLATVCEWVVKSWAEVKTECIVKSFKKCSISNAMDGTEDDLLWQEDDEDVVTGQRSCNQPRRWHGDCQRMGHAFRGIGWWRVWWILNSKNLVHLLMAIKFLIFVSCRVHEQCTLSVSCHSWNRLTMYSICTVNEEFGAKTA